MLLQYSWLSSLLVASATANVYRPAGLKPRYLSGTGISQPPSSLPPYPTGTANATIIPTGSSPTTSPTPTPTLLPPTELFYLLITAPGTTYDGNYLYIGSNTNRDGQLVLYPSGNRPSSPLGYVQFNLNADGTLQSNFPNGPNAIAVVYSDADYNEITFFPEGVAEGLGFVNSVCGVLVGNLICRTGRDAVFYICPFVVILGTLTGGAVEVGVDTKAGCTGVGLLVVPV